MKKTTLSVVLALTLALAACGVDTTGISAKSTKTPRGNLSSPVVVTEYGDFQCPACRVANQVIVQPLFQKYGSRVQFQFKQFPLLSIHEFSLPMAEASECAADQGKFWEYLETAYGKQLEMDAKNQANPSAAPQEATAADIDAWAQSIGLKMDLYTRCTTSHIKRDAIMAEFNEGRSLGVNGTPTFFVNGKKMDGNDLAAISAAIDDALKSAPPAAKL